MNVAVGVAVLMLGGWTFGDAPEDQQDQNNPQQGTAAPGPTTGPRRSAAAGGSSTNAYPGGSPYGPYGGGSTAAGKNPFPLGPLGMIPLEPTNPALKGFGFGLPPEPTSPPTTSGFVPGPGGLMPMQGQMPAPPTAYPRMPGGYASGTGPSTFYNMLSTQQSRIGLPSPGSPPLVGPPLPAKPFAGPTGPMAAGGSRRLHEPLPTEQRRHDRQLQHPGPSGAPADEHQPAGGERRFRVGTPEPDPTSHGATAQMRL